jgi:hypothetical protein
MMTDCPRAKGKAIAIASERISTYNTSGSDVGSLFRFFKAWIGLGRTDGAFQVYARPKDQAA